MTRWNREERRLLNEVRGELSASVCIDEDCTLSFGEAHVGLCEPCQCGLEHAAAECPADRSLHRSADNTRRRRQSSDSDETMS